MTGTERDKLNVIERRIDVMQRDIEHALSKMQGMEERQKEMSSDIKVLVDRTWENKVQYGIVSAVIAAAVSIFGGQFKQ